MSFKDMLEAIKKYDPENPIKGSKFKNVTLADSKNYRTVIFRTTDGRDFYPVMVSDKFPDTVIDEIIKVIEKAVK